MATRANKVEVEITASDEASPKIDKLAHKIDGLEADEARVTVTANTDRLEKQLAAAKQKLEQLDGDEATVQARLVGTIEKDLKDARDLFEQLDGQTGTVKLNADTSQLDKGLDESASKVGKLGDLAGELPGPLGEAAGLLSGPGGIAGGAALAAGSLLAMAQSAADTALEAQTIADLTGATVQDASRWLALSKQAGIEYGDLADIVGQVGQVLAQTPQLAKQLGININDGKDGLERIVQVLDQVNASTDNATERANMLGQLFGEQGVRQVQALATAVGGDLKKALDGVSGAQIISPEDVKRAREFKQMWAQAMGYAQGLALTIGQDVIPVLTTAVELVKGINDGLKGLIGVDLVDVNKWVSPWGQLSFAIKGASDELDRLRGIEDETVTVYSRAADAVADVVVQEIAHGKAIEQQKIAQEAGNEQLAAYLELLTQKGDEAAEEKRVTDQAQRHADAIANVNTQAERVDRARIVERERTAVQRVRDEYQKLRDDLADRKSLLQLQQSFDDLRDKAVDAWGAAATGAEDAEQKQRDYQISQLDTIDNALAYAETLDNLPAKVVTDIEALIDEGKYDEAARRLEILTAPRSAELQLKLNEQDLQRQLAAWYARNGINPRFAPSSVAPPAAGGAVPASTVVNVNMPRGSRGVDVLNQITNQTRRSGRRYGVPVVNHARR